MPQNDDTTTTHEPLAEVKHTDDGLPAVPLGSANVQIDVDPDTYERLHAEYCQAVERGHPDSFDIFAFNHCSTDCYVTVDGSPVDPDAEPQS
jgi:hypothetical protein